MKLETKLGIYFIIALICMLGGLSVMMWPTGLVWQTGVPLKVGGIILFGVGTIVYNKHFKYNEYE